MKVNMKLILISFIAACTLSGCINYVPMPDLALEVKNYPNPEEISNLSFALAQPDIKVNTAMTFTTNSGLFERVKHNTNDVSCYLTTEINKILLSKGFTITDIFQSYNNMTFTQKRNTSALFFPEIIINVEEKTQLEDFRFFLIHTQTMKGTLKISATVNIVMLEPLSGEKIWIKSLPMEEFDEYVQYKPLRYGGPQLNGLMVPEDLSSIAAKIDRMYEKVSDEIILAANSYVEKNEFEFLNSDIEKLKTIKRY